MPSIEARTHKALSNSPGGIKEGFLEVLVEILGPPLSKIPEMDE